MSPTPLPPHGLAAVANEGITAEELAELVRRTAEANSAWMRGDGGGYVALNSHADDLTPMGPFGGSPTLGFEAWNAGAARAARGFRGGESELELVQAYASGDLVVLVTIERQHGEVGGLPDQDWSLRVTQVYRREGTEWRAVHRHADRLVRGRDLGQTAALARG